MLVNCQSLWQFAEQETAGYSLSQSFSSSSTDHFSGLLKPSVGSVLCRFQRARNVHLLPFPAVQNDLFDKGVQEEVRLAQQVIHLGHVVGERHGLSLRALLSSAVVIADKRNLDGLESITG